MRKKPGAFATKEIEFIEENMDILSPEDIAEKLNRRVDKVREQIAKMPKRGVKLEQQDILTQLHNKYFWSALEQGLSPEELRYFEAGWTQYLHQFGASEILPTDEMMIKDLVILDIYCDRALRQRRVAQTEIDRLNRLINDELAKDMINQNMSDLMNWRTQVSSIFPAYNTANKDYIEFQQKKDSKLKDLKATREQRFKQIQESHSNFFDLIKELDTQRSRATEGKWAEKMKIAGARVRQDWSKLKTFSDGDVDKVLLSPEGELEDEDKSDDMGN